MDSDTLEEYKFRILMAEESLLDRISRSDSEIKDLCDSIINRRVLLELSTASDRAENYLHLVFVAALSGGGRDLHSDISKHNLADSGDSASVILMAVCGNILSHMMILGDFDPEYLAEQMSIIGLVCQVSRISGEDEAGRVRSVVKLSNAIISLTRLAQYTDSEAIRQKSIDLIQEAINSSAGTKLETLFAIGKAAMFSFVERISPGEYSIASSLN